MRASVYDDASVSEHLLEWLVNTLPTGSTETAGDAAVGELMPLIVCDGRCSSITGLRMCTHTQPQRHDL